MNWEVLIYACAIMMAAVLMVCIYGAVKLWKAGNKFGGFMYLVVGIAVGIGGYAIFGEKIAKLFQ